MWYLINDDNREKLCSFSDRGWSFLKGYAEGKGYIQMGYFDRDIPLPYLFCAGSDKGAYAFAKGMSKNPSLIGYPYIDHAFCLRDGNDNIALVSSTYCNDSEILKFNAELVSFYGILEVTGLSESLYGNGTTSLIIRLKRV